MNTRGLFWEKKTRELRVPRKRRESPSYDSSFLINQTVFNELDEKTS